MLEDVLTGNACANRMIGVICMIGNRYNNWTIIDYAEDRIDSSGKHHKRCVCRCDCGTVIEKDLYKVKNGAKMCKSCHVKKLISASIPFEKLTNRYDLSGDYGIGYVNNSNMEFYFDLEDYDKVREHCWSNSGGYIHTHINGKSVSLHRLIMGLSGNHDRVTIVDHINRKPHDNRKSNLRICTVNENAKNRSIGKNNTSGVVGVVYDTQSRKWLAYINADKKNIRLGLFENIEDAIRIRKDSEKKYFGQFAHK